jgi:O-antigen/teichoic acid export membrane protein
VTPIFTAAYPRLAELVASGQEHLLAREYHAFSQITAFTVLPIAATLAVFAPEAVYAWTGDRQLTAYVAPIVTAWVVGSALNGVMHLPYALQLAIGWVRLSIAMNVVAVAVMLPSLLVLVPRYGAVAAGWIWAVVNLFYFTVGVHVMHRRVLPAEASRWYLRDLGLPGSAILASTAAAVALRFWLQPEGRIASAGLVAAALLASTACALLASPTGRGLAAAAARAARSGHAVARQ